MGELGLPSMNICLLCLYPMENTEDTEEILRDYKELVVDLPEANEQEGRCSCTMRVRRTAMFIMDNHKRSKFNEWCAKYRANGCSDEFRTTTKSTVMRLDHE